MALGEGEVVDQGALCHLDLNQAGINAVVCQGSNDVVGKVFAHQFNA